MSISDRVPSHADKSKISDAFEHQMVSHRILRVQEHLVNMKHARAGESLSRESEVEGCWSS